MPLTFGCRLTLADPPRVFLNGQLLQVHKGFRYLGVWWDGSLTFTDHFNRVRKRVDLLSYRLSVVADRFFSRNAQLHLRIYKGAIEPFILYGYGAWGNRIHLQKIRSTLNSIQSRPLLQMTGAYRTVSTVALQVIAGVLPLDLKAVEALAKFRVKVLRRDMEVGSRAFCSSNYLSRVHIFASHPSTWTVHPFLYIGPLGSDIEIFTDGSKMNGHVGCSVVVYYHGQLIHTEGHRLNDEASVYQAEISGFTLALSFVQRILYWDTVRIFTDSLSLLQALESAQTIDPAIWQLKATLREKKQNRAISLHWVKAHVGTAGNEMADLVAKHATTKAQPDQILLRSLTHINSELKAELLSQWQDRWILVINGRTTAEFLPQVDLCQPAHPSNFDGSWEVPFLFSSFCAHGP
ncbi:hypothetical protein AVEN_84924-1 [Araneus ventricosus]|uniref:RNase H type-1 domain-containing protein n=1 Tax=Araneus ventricosus TaxID=182803 RepID=A0A4Y2C1H1_ARAVE|nr:hypothetical protein AVEN_84924-1 [Araneus ventricosus]